MMIHPNPYFVFFCFDKNFLFNVKEQKFLLSFSLKFKLNVRNAQGIKLIALKHQQKCM